jgi:hypothetical protein
MTGRYVRRRNGDRKILEGEKVTGRYVRRRNGDRKIF